MIFSHFEMDKETRAKVVRKMTTERDLRNQMAYACKVATEEGRAEGLAEVWLKVERKVEQIWSYLA